MKRVLLSLVVLASFALNAVVVPAEKGIKLSRSKKAQHTEQHEHKSAHQSEKERLQKEIDAKTAAYEQDHKQAQANPHNEKLHAKMLRESQDIQRLQAQLGELKKGR